MATETEFDPYGLPKDIFLPTIPLIGMTGLDIENNPSHKLVWDTFSTNRNFDRISLNLKLIGEDLNLPPMKQKRQSYEWYIPKGILKSNWTQKYLNVVPSLLVLFWDLDWNDPNWVDKKNEITQRIQSLRTSLMGRSTRLAVVLLQTSSSSNVPGEEGGAAEKAAILCANCDLPPKHLFVLPRSDAHLLGYAIRLENALNEIAGGFYLSEIKCIKTHRDFLNKTNHHILFIRHQYKLGFHNEMRNDQTAALKHYRLCYQLLFDHRITNTNLHEIRIIAGIINYKICQLDFALNLPRDAIEQFKRHIDVFRQRTGPKELIFEHYAWLSKQYQIFAHVFEEAVQNGLPAVQTQHPGFYYQQAAQYVVLRRNLAFQMCKDIVSPTEDMLQGWESLEFYGQRPWRPGKHLLEPPESASELEGTKAICYHEVNVIKHSDLVIPLFSLAIAQFQKHRCQGIKRYLMVQMAKEYIEGRNPAKALTLLNHVMWDYRTENWKPLLTNCSFMALTCSYQTASLSDYLANCFDILGTRVNATEVEKKRVLGNLQKVIQGEVPDPEPDLTPEMVSSALESWLSIDRSSVTVDMSVLVPCLEVRASFEREVSRVDMPFQINVKIKNDLCVPIQLLHVTVKTMSSCGEVREVNPEKILVPPESILEVPLMFQPNVKDMKNTIKILGVNVGLGSSWDQSITLQWVGGGDQGAAAHILKGKHKEFCLKLNPFEFDLITEAEIISRSPLMEVEIRYDEAALVWEWLPLSIRLKNLESVTASNVAISLSLDGSSDSSHHRTTQISIPSNLESKLSASNVTDHGVGDFAPNDEKVCVLYIKALTASRRHLKLEVQYSSFIDLNGKKVSCPSLSSQKFVLTAKMPFQITVETQSLKFEAISKVSKSEKFLVVPKITCSSHVPITFIHSSLVLANGVALCGESFSQVSKIELENYEEATDCFPVSFHKDVAQIDDLSLGQYMLYWKRASGDSPTVSVSVGLPTISVEDPGVWVDACIPSHGRVRVPMTVSYDIKNTLGTLQEITASMEVSDAFMFSGYKEVRLRILPGWHETMTYTLYPLLAGYVQLPKLCIDCDSSGSGPTISLEPFLSRILPTHTFIMPQAKKSTLEQETKTTIPVA